MPAGLSALALTYSSWCPSCLQAGNDERDPLVRENVPDSDDEGEQTWPTEAELADAKNMFQRRLNRHKVPEGRTAEMNGCWGMMLCSCSGR